MGKVNFRIIDGDKWNSKVDYEQLKLDYLNPSISVKEILKKHNISRGEYYRQRKIIVEETGVKIKPSYNGGTSQIVDVMRYITQDPLSQKYRVQKYIDGMLRHYGRYKDLEEAIRVRDALIEHDWDWQYYWENIRPHVFTEFPFSSRKDIADDFEKDYLDGMTGKQLKKKYGLSAYHYNNLSTSIKHKHGLTRKPTKVTA